MRAPPSDITAQSLRPGGATELLCGQVDTDIIKLDAMFRYLHAQAVPLMAPLAKIMLRHGTYTLARGS
eukprot:CAMPEP_0172464744 /NCGR_PEP_ID=MMETSP1065-20121228/51450_1 /TAXON_ID=265537 /ORGANISM="Amphiprora paludosa, Strain CCMP125" /LENGTH=67 /DNA_ID=CAMNT_0013221079 /DNA_START=17 /DNA_END=218 /DNA_ORIENTATION=-